MNNNSQQVSTFTCDFDITSFDFSMLPDVQHDNPFDMPQIPTIASNFAFSVLPQAPTAPTLVNNEHCHWSLQEWEVALQGQYFSPFHKLTEESYNTVLNLRDHQDPNVRLQATSLTTAFEESRKECCIPIELESTHHRRVQRRLKPIVYRKNQFLAPEWMQRLQAGKFIDISSFSTNAFARFFSLCNHEEDEVRSTVFRICNATSLYPRIIQCIQEKSVPMFLGVMQFLASIEDKSPIWNVCYSLLLNSESLNLSHEYVQTRGQLFLRYIENEPSLLDKDSEMVIRELIPIMGISALRTGGIDALNGLLDRSNFAFLKNKFHAPLFLDIVLQWCQKSMRGDPIKCLQVLENLVIAEVRLTDDLGAAIVNCSQLCKHLHTKDCWSSMEVLIAYMNGHASTYNSIICVQDLYMAYYESLCTCLEASTLLSKLISDKYALAWVKQCLNKFSSQNAFLLAIKFIRSSNNERAKDVIVLFFYSSVQGVYNEYFPENTKSWFDLLIHSNKVLSSVLRRELLIWSTILLKEDFEQQAVYVFVLFLSLFREFWNSTLPECCNLTLTRIASEILSCNVDSWFVLQILETVKGNGSFCRAVAPMCLQNCMEQVSDYLELESAENIATIYSIVLPFASKQAIVEFVVPVASKLFQLIDNHVTEDDDDDDDDYNFLSNALDIFAAASANPYALPQIAQHLLIPLLTNYDRFLWNECQQMDALLVNLIAHNKELVKPYWQKILNYSANSKAVSRYLAWNERQLYATTSSRKLEPFVLSCTLCSSSLDTIPQFVDNYKFKRDEPIAWFALDISLQLQVSALCVWICRVADVSDYITTSKMKLVLADFKQVPLGIDSFVDMLYINTCGYLKRQLRKYKRYFDKSDERKCQRMACQHSSFAIVAAPYRDLHVCAE